MLVLDMHHSSYMFLANPTSVHDCVNDNQGDDKVHYEWMCILETT